VLDQGSDPYLRRNRTEGQPLRTGPAGGIQPVPYGAVGFPGSILYAIETGPFTQRTRPLKRCFHLRDADVVLSLQPKGTVAPALMAPGS
jgi:hypothetical protein